MLHLDALRLIASAGIVVAHVATFLDPGPVGDRIIGWTRPFILFVDMFFVVSGFVIAFVYSAKLVSGRSYLSFLRRRVARLGPLHWLTLAIFASIGIAEHYLHIRLNHPELYDPRCFVPNLMFLHSLGLCRELSFNSVSWSISAEMVMYVASPLLFWVLRRSPVALGMLAGIAWVALTVLAPTDWYRWTFAGGAIRAIPSFAFGAYLFAVRAPLARLPLASWGFWCCLLVFIGGCGIGAPWLLLMLALYGAVACGVAADAQQRPSGVVSLLAAGGQLTYSSYMLHALVMIVILNTLADHVLHAHGGPRYLMAGLAFALVWPISYLSLVFFERPARERLSGPRKPKSSATPTRAD